MYLRYKRQSNRRGETYPKSGTRSCRIGHATLHSIRKVSSRILVDEIRRELTDVRGASLFRRASMSLVSSNTHHAPDAIERQGQVESQ